MTEYYAQIEDYLSGAVQGEARARFEEALKGDAELAAEVALYRDMAIALAPGKEDALRANLEQLGKQYVPAGPTPSPARQWWWIAAVLILLVGLAGWFWQSGRQLVPPSEIPAEKMPPTQVDTITTRPVTPEKTEVTVPIAGQEPPPEKPEKAQLAANFQPNPRLEGMLNNQYRGEKYRFRVMQPTATTQLKKKGDNAIFQLSGVLESGATIVEPPFRVLLFSNRPKDFEDFRPVFSENLTFEKAEKDFRFRFEKPLKLATGLYYFLIEDQESGMPYYVGKVQVQ